MKTARVIVCILAFSLTLSQGGYLSVYGGAEMRISAQKKSEGIVSVDVKTDSDKRLRIGVEALNSDMEYFFTYNKSEGEVNIPLMFGNGKYSIGLYEELSNKHYQLLDSYDLDLQLADYSTVYLSSSVIVPWESAEAMIAKAAELTLNKKSDFEKFHAIYKFVTENIVYDMAKTTESGYRSSPDTTLNDGSGICLDIAVLLAAMLRSAGVKCKLVYGQAKDMSGLHSWNVVYFRNRWVIVDPTKDSQFYVSGISYRYAKLQKDYKGIFTF